MSGIEKAPHPQLSCFERDLSRGGAAFETWRDPAASPLLVRMHQNIGRDLARLCQPKPAAALPLYSQYRVCSSVQPGTAKPLVTLGTVTPWVGRKWRSCGLKRRTVAASAEAHKVINRPKAKTDRIAICSGTFTRYFDGLTALGMH